MIDIQCLQVVNGSELIGEVLDQDSLYFFAPPRRHTEQEYLIYLQSQQKLLQQYKAGEIIVDPEYLRYATLDQFNTSNLPLVKSDTTSDFAIKYERPIKLIKTAQGYKFADSDGRHRFYITKKYKLDILANIIEEKMEDAILDKQYMFTKYIFVVYCIIKVPKVAETIPQSCMRNFPIIADAVWYFPKPIYRM